VSEVIKEKQDSMEVLGFMVLMVPKVPRELKVDSDKQGEQDVLV
jgi:hypothetical protein